MEFLNDLVDRFWIFISDYQQQTEENNDFFLDIFRSIIHLFLKWIADGWSFLFGEFTTFIYSLLFDNYDSTVNTGKFAVDRIFSFQPSGDVFSFDMIYFFFGCIFTIFIFKFILNAFLSIVGKL